MCVVIDEEETRLTDGVGELAVTVTLVVGLDDDGLAASEAAVQQHNNFSVLDTVDNQARKSKSVCAALMVDCWGTWLHKAASWSLVIR